MNRESLQQLIQNLYDKKIEPQEAYERLKNLPYEDLGFAQVDHHRSLRNGMPEVIYCEGKTPDQIKTLIDKMDQAETDILATRLAPEIYQQIQSGLPSQAQYNPEGRTLILQRKPQQKKAGHILVLTAGTSDIPVAEEAVATAGLLGSRVETAYDVGVAGIHRLLDKMDRLREARGDHCGGGDGWCPGECCRRAGGVPGHCRPYPGRLWGCIRGTGRLIDHAQLLLSGRFGGQH